MEGTSVETERDHESEKASEKEVSEERARARKERARGEDSPSHQRHVKPSNDPQRVLMGVLSQEKQSLNQREPLSSVRLPFLDVESAPSVMNFSLE